MSLIESSIHVGAKVDELAVNPVESGIHVGAKVDEFTFDDCELADDFAKVGVDLDSHVVEVLLCCWLVHGLTVMISHSRTDICENEIVGGMGRSVTQAVL